MSVHMERRIFSGYTYSFPFHSSNYHQCAVFVHNIKLFENWSLLSFRSGGYRAGLIRMPCTTLTQIILENVMLFNLVAIFWIYI